MVPNQARFSGDRSCFVGVIAHASVALAVLVMLTGAVAARSPHVWKAEGWEKTDFSKSSIEFTEILSGGPPKDGIPSIDNPKFTTADKARHLSEREPVIGLEINGEARAYPLQVLTWHEIVNDTVAGQPVAVTYCPLCNAAIVFDRVLDGQKLEFGTTGKLRKSDLVMYDRQSESWWQQFTGEAIVGAMLGQQLRIIPSRLESFGEFKTRHPAGKVLIPNNPQMRAYGHNPYASYDSTSRPFLFSGPFPEGIPAMARVVVVRDGDKPTAVSLKLVRELGELAVGGVTLGWRAGQASALDTTEISKGRDVGTVTAMRSSANGTEHVAYDVTFAFVFHAFHPELPIATTQEDLAASRQ